MSGNTIWDHRRHGDTPAALRLPRRTVLTGAWAWAWVIPWAGALGLSLGLLPDARAATPGVDEPPLPQAQRALVLPAVQTARLANGLDIVVAARPGLPVLTLTLLVRAGPEADPPGRPGVALMTSTLWPKGARRAGKPVPAAALARQAEALGGGLEVGSAYGASSLSMTVSSPRMGDALALMGDVLRHPLLAADELARARAQAQDGLRVTLGNPADVAALALRRSFWGDVPHGQVLLPSALQKLSRADVLAFQARWVRPDRVALVVAGDVTASQVQALAQRLLGDWRAPAGDAPVPLLAPPATGPDALLLIDMPGSGQSAVAVAAPYLRNSVRNNARNDIRNSVQNSVQNGVQNSVQSSALSGMANSAGSAVSGSPVSGGADTAAPDRPQRFAGLLAQSVLGGGYSARLNQEVRIKRGLSYGVVASAESFAPGGMFSARAQTDHRTAAEVLRLLRAEIAGLADTPPAADELAARAATLVGSFARRLETTAGLAATLAGQLAQGRAPADLADELAAYAPGVLAVTPAQVQAFARTQWQAGALRAVVAGDLAAAGDSFAPLDPQARRLPISALDPTPPGLRKPAAR